MPLTLESIGMQKGARYEAIYTTMSKDSEVNAASIGVKCINENEIEARIFDGSRTLANIKQTNHFVVNITYDPNSYANALYGNLDKFEFVKEEGIAYLKNAEAYLVAHVKSIQEVEAKKDHVNEGAKSFVVTGEAAKIVINKKSVKALNRGLYSFLESLVDYTRVDVIDDVKKEEYKNRFLENERVIESVAESDVKEAMSTLREKMIEKGLDL